MTKTVLTVCYGFKKHNKAIISLKGRNARTQGKDKKTEKDTPRKHSPKEQWAGYTNIRQKRL